MISVVIPLYNKENEIANTLQSVLRQSYQNFEIVIVDDGSTDESVEVVAQLKDDRIRLITQTNQGVSAVRNRGIHEAKYKYIAFLDADDEWAPDYLATQIQLIQKFPECGVFACAYEFHEEDGSIKNLILNKITFKETQGILSNYFEVAACSHPPLWTSAIVVEKEAILSVGGFPLGVDLGEDLLTWAKLAVRYRIAYDITPLAYYNRINPEKDENKPSRKPQIIDVVGHSLESLYAANPHIPGLKKYVALWYKMRTSIFLHLYDRKSACTNVLKALKYDKRNWKVYLFVLMILLPKKLQKVIKEQYN
jgi:glycosyltransferase involved in cell wall biosynthesis